MTKNVNQIAYDNLVEVLTDEEVSNLIEDIEAINHKGEPIGFEFLPEETDVNDPADILLGAFRWGEGLTEFEYWQSVYDRLVENNA